MNLDCGIETLVNWANGKMGSWDLGWLERWDIGIFATRAQRLGCYGADTLGQWKAGSLTGLVAGTLGHWEVGGITLRSFRAENLGHYDIWTLGDWPAATREGWVVCKVGKLGYLESRELRHWNFGRLDDLDNMRWLQHWDTETFGH